jgi:hypothetical protein
MPPITHPITLGYTLRTRLAPDQALEKAMQTFQDRGREVVVDEQPTGSTNSGETGLRFQVRGSIMTDTLLLESSIEVSVTAVRGKSSKKSEATEIELMLSSEAMTAADVREAWPEARRQLDAEYAAIRFAMEWHDMVSDLPDGTDCFSL